MSLPRGDMVKCELLCMLAQESAVTFFSPCYLWGREAGELKGRRKPLELLNESTAPSGRSSSLQRLHGSLVLASLFCFM